MSKIALFILISEVQTKARGRRDVLSLPPRQHQLPHHSHLRTFYCLIRRTLAFLDGVRKQDIVVLHCMREGSDSLRTTSGAVPLINRGMPRSRSQRQHLYITVRLELDNKQSRYVKTYESMRRLA